MLTQSEKINNHNFSVKNEFRNLQCIYKYKFKYFGSYIIKLKGTTYYTFFYISEIDVEDPTTNFKLEVLLYDETALHNVKVGQSISIHDSTLYKNKA